jgi:hypothetical protein
LQRNTRSQKHVAIKTTTSIIKRNNNAGFNRTRVA